MNTDIDLFISKLGRIKGFGDAGSFLQNIVQAKQVKEENDAKAQKTTEAPEQSAQEEDNEETKQAEDTEGTKVIEEVSNEETGGEVTKDPVAKDDA